MTRIQYIRGIGADEMPDRGREVKGQPFLPYTSFTQGEMTVALAAERAKMFAQAFPDYPEYQQATVMLENALYSGVHNKNSFLGLLDNEVLQWAAGIISKAERYKSPVSGSITGRTTLSQGVAIGEIVPFKDIDCVIYARDKTNAKFKINKSHTYYTSGYGDPIQKAEYKKAKAECETKNAIQRIVNDKIESAAHHVVYNKINPGFPGVQGSDMGTKRILHDGGIGGLALVTDMGSSYIREWTENGVLRYNSQSGAGLIGSQQSGFAIATDGNDGIFDAYAKYQKESGAGIGMAQVVVLAIIALAQSALTVAGEFAKALREKQASALASAQGYGTSAYLAQKGDFKNISSGTTSNNNLLLLGALGLGGYLLLSDD